MSTPSFEEIAIVDLDLVKTTWSRVHSSMRTLYLRLTREPEMAWVRFFHEERESRIVLKRHGLWIEDGYIVFDCLLEDVENYHLPDFRLSVAYANQKYLEMLAVRREQGEQQRDDARVEEQELAALRARIRGGTPVAALPRLAQVMRVDTDAPAAAATAPVVTTTISWTPATITTAAVPAWVAASKAAREKLAYAPTVPAQITASGLVAAASSEPTPSMTATESTPQTVDVAPPAPVPGPIPVAQVEAVPTAEPATMTPAPSTPEQRPESAANADIADFNAKREEWRARFRAALASRPKEPARGND